MLFDLIYFAIWIVLILYAVIKAMKVKPTEKRIGMNFFQKIILALISFFLFFESFGFPVQIFPLDYNLLSNSSILKHSGILVMLIGLVFYIFARKELGENWSDSSAAVFRKEHKLITTGLYKYSRNPIYLGLIVVFIGNAMFIGTSGSIILLLFIIAGLAFSVRREEKYLTIYFSDEYPAYKKRVKAIIPFIW